MRARPTPPPPDLVRAWSAGWARARGLDPADEVAPGVLRTRVGAPGRGTELLVLDADRHPRRTDVAAQASWDERDPWLTVPTADPGRVADRLAEHGLATATIPEWLMTRSHTTSAPATTPVTLPPGYAASTSSPTPHRIEVVVRAPDGSTAATGRLGIEGTTGVPDRIATSASHRRRGLGSAVMGLLDDAAAAAGATRGVLVASEQGRRLYLALGWELVGAVVVARRR